jgi:hypothetical protein
MVAERKECWWRSANGELIILRKGLTYANVAIKWNNKMESTRVLPRESASGFYRQTISALKSTLVISAVLAPSRFPARL